MAFSAFATLGLANAASAESLQYTFELVSPGATPLAGAAYVLSVSDQTRAGTDLGADQVRFTLTNANGVGSIHEIYFDDDASPLLVSSLDGLSPWVSDSDGPLLTPKSTNPKVKPSVRDRVNFVWGQADPGHLPGGGNATPPFEVTAGLLADLSGNIKAGINGPSEWLDLTFLLTPGNSYDTVLAALDARALRVGLHVGDSTGTADDPESGAWVSPGSPNPGATPVPLPATSVAALTLMGGWALGRRRRPQ